MGPLTYHVGHPADPEDSARRRAQGLPVYTPTDPKPTDQRPYLAFAAKSTTRQYQEEAT